jgi:hypothetical protein
MMTPRRWPVLPLLLVSCAALAQAQPATRTLAKPDAEFAEPFSQLNAVRELRDGRLLVTDSRDKLVQLINLTSGKATKVGREGSGPGEYGLPAQLFALPADSSVVFDPLNQRFLLLLPDGKPGATFRVGDDAPRPSADANGGRVVRLGGLGLGMPRGSDGRGNLYFEGPAISFGPDGPVVADSAPVVRYSRATKRADTLAWVQLPKSDAAVSSTGSGGQQNVNVRIGGISPYPSRDQWTVLPSGTVAIARVRDYHVELVSATRQVTRGPAVTFAPVRVGDAEKEEYRKAAKNPQGVAISRTTENRNGVENTRTSTAMPAFEEPKSWPATKPPFTSVVAGANGEVWVARSRPARDEVPTYDVFDGTGRLTGRVALPKRTRVVAVGATYVYTARTDDDDLQYLQRFRR